jgi:hypothetical protein
MSAGDAGPISVVRTVAPGSYLAAPGGNLAVTVGCLAVLLLGVAAPATAQGGAPARDPSAAGAETEAVEAAEAPQAVDSAWNSPDAVRIARQAVQAREHAYADSSLRSFQARAQGHIYFLGEFEKNRELVRADQVALQILWEAPDRALQTIVGRRHEVRLPTRIQYHIDHLSLVLDNFGDRIRLGEGDEVWNVLHPAAPGALRYYEYRLVDSFEIRVRDRVAHVERVDVRPLDPSLPGVVGTMYVDRESGAIARLRATFTRASYRDPDLEYITLDLKSAFWEGRYWLPYEQDLEIRRQLSWFSFPVGSLIRTRIRVLDYDINDTPQYRIASGDRIASLPATVLADYWEWETPLYAGPLAESDLSDNELARTRSRARELVRPQALLGGERLQLHLPNASAGLRARRAEGVLIGGGGAYRLDERSELSFWGGYAFGLDQPQIRLGAHRGSGSWRVSVEGYYHALEDVGHFQAASGLTRTLALAFDGEDYTDPYFEDGGSLGVSGPALGGRASIGIAAANHRSADLIMQTVLIGQTALRPVRPIDEGTLVALEASFERDLGRVLQTSWRLELDGEASPGAIGDFGFTQALLMLRGERAEAGGDWHWTARLGLGAAGGELPAQRLFLLGGRGTLPGHPFRSWGGDRVAWLDADISRALVAPWVRIRALGSLGWTDLTSVGQAAADRFGVAQTAGTKASAGVGLGLLYDLLRIDLSRGLDGGEWEVFVSVNRALWSVL